MNQLVPQFDASVPAFLRNANFLQINQKAVQGLSSGAPPRLSFRGSRLRFVAADGTETPVTENNGVAIDVVVIDASEHVSKFYYDQAYDPNADDLAPACFSDNGVGPSVRSTKPQSLLCANCPKNAWGSKVTPQGTQVKACSDVKKLALIPASNVNGPAYMIGVPGASLKTWSAFVDTVSKRGIPIPALVVQIGFDASAEYPKLTFTPKRYIDETEAAAIQELFGSEECDELVGRKDTPITALPGTGTTGVVHGALHSEYAMKQAAHDAEAARRGLTGGVPAGVATPITMQPQDPRGPLPAFLDRSQPQFAGATQQAPAAEAQPVRRRRRTQAEMQAANAGQTQGVAPTQPAIVQAPVVQAAAGPADLNALLDKVMGAK